MSSPYGIAIIVCCVGGVLWLLTALVLHAETQEPREFVEKWAKEQQATVLSCRRRLLFQGPFFFSPFMRGDNDSPKWVVLRLRLRKHDGQVSTGWARVRVNLAEGPDDAEFGWD